MSDAHGATLPAPVARFAAAATPASGARLRTVALETDAWMSRPGIPRIPLTIRMSHVLGEAFVHDIRIGRSPLSFRFGLDAFVDDHGLVRIGRTVRFGPRIDQGTLVAMWGEALIFPEAWIGRPDVEWAPVGELTARLIVPGPSGPVSMDVEFDPATGLPSICRADRYKDDGPLTPWTGRWSDWRPVGRGDLVPQRMRVRWLDEPKPWLDIRVRRVLIDAPVDAELERVRRIREGATRRGTEPKRRSTRSPST